MTSLEWTVVVILALVLVAWYLSYLSLIHI